jgi:hypothetical protein
MTPFQFTKLMIELEKDYGLLTADMLHQDNLLDIQETILSKLAALANDKPPLGRWLAKELPYIFTTTITTKETT